MLGTNSLMQGIQCNKFKAKSEIECGMRDIFEKPSDMIGFIQCLRHLLSYGMSGVQSNVITGNRSQNKGKFSI